MVLNKRRRNGFTLIELLVVIAIIGVLTAIVTQQTNSARDKAKVVAIEAQVSGIRAQAELYSYDFGSYVGLCAHSQVLNAINAIEEHIVGTVTCNDAALEFVVSTPLPLGGYFCADSSGFAGDRTLDLGMGATTCPAS